MKRRNFIKSAALFAAGLPIVRSRPLFSKNLFVPSAKATRFNLSLLTDDASVAIREIEMLLKDLHLSNQKVRFAEHRLVGNHVGDIVMIEGGKLVNFRQDDSALSRYLREISHRLSLPKKLADPVLLAFYSDRNVASPSKVSIFRDNYLIERIELQNDLDAYTIDGTKGSVTLAVNHGAARIIHASCKHKTCMKLGSICQPGQHLLCIPNRIRISIEGKNENEIDGIVF
ncbi:MAG: NusG domain II-containing protein [bacterium]